MTRLTHGARDHSPPRVTSHEHTAAAVPPEREHEHMREREREADWAVPRVPAKT